MNRLKELREKKGKLIADGRALLDRVSAEKRELTDDENKQYDAIHAELRGVMKTIEAEERQVEMDREAAQRAIDEKKEERKEKTEQPSAWARFLRGGLNLLNGEELRALSSGSDTAGGFLVAPEQFVNRLLKAVDDAVFIRGLATKYPVPAAASLGVPTLEADPADADWTVELGTGSEDSTMALGKRALSPHPFAKRIKVSNQLIRQATIDPEALVLQRLAYKFGITEEKAFMTGNGAQRPLGLFTASNDGIPTTRDVSTGNTTTSITFDGLIEAKYTLKGAYHPNAQWIFHRDAVKMLNKLKDGEGQYIWRESVRAGEPDRLLGLPFRMSEYAPNTFTSGLYVGILGDYSYYWIADALSMQMQRLTELYAETNQVGFIGRQECDGMPVLSGAFVRVTLAS